MKTTVYLVRHGDVHNPEKVFYGRLPNFHLSKLGEHQAHRLGKFLSGKAIHALYASPLTRTQETASIIASYHKALAITPDERLLEVLSITQGRLMEELAGQRWNFYQPKYIKLGGERLSDVWARMSHFFREKVGKHQGQTFVAVSHGDPIMVSKIKHEGKRLSLAVIRGEYYVQTARGIKLVFDETGVSVSELQF